MLLGLALIMQVGLAQAMAASSTQASRSIPLVSPGAVASSLGALRGEHLAAQSIRYLNTLSDSGNGVELIEAIRALPMEDLNLSDVLALGSVLQILRNPEAARASFPRILEDSRAPGEVLGIARDAGKDKAFRVGLQSSLERLARRVSSLVGISRLQPEDIGRISRHVFDGGIWGEGLLSLNAGEAGRFAPPDARPISWGDLRIGDFIVTERHGPGAVRETGGGLVKAFFDPLGPLQPDQKTGQLLQGFPVTSPIPVFRIDSDLVGSEQEGFRNRRDALREEVRLLADFFRLSEFQDLTHIGFFKTIAEYRPLSETQQYSFESVRGRAILRSLFRGVLLEGLNYYERTFIDYERGNPPLGESARNHLSWAGFKAFLRRAFEAETGRLSPALKERYRKSLRMKLSGRPTLMTGEILTSQAIHAMVSKGLDQLYDSLELFAAGAGLVVRMEDAAFERRRQAILAELDAAESKTPVPSGPAPQEESLRVARAAVLLALRDLWNQGYMSLSWEVIHHFPNLREEIKNIKPKVSLMSIGLEAGLPAGRVDVRHTRFNRVQLRPSHIEWFRKAYPDSLQAGLEKFPYNPIASSSLLYSFGGFGRVALRLGMPFDPIPLGDMPEELKPYVDFVSAETLLRLTELSIEFEEDKGLETGGP